MVQARRQLGDQARWRLVERVVPHLRADKLRRTTGEQDKQCNPGFQCGEIKPQNLWLKKSVGVAAAGETPSLTGEFTGETHRVLGHTQTTHPRNQHQKGPICLWVAEEVTQSQLGAEQGALFPLRPLLPYSAHRISRWVASPWWIFKAPPLMRHWHTKTKKNMTQMKEWSKLQKKYNKMMKR